MLYKIVLGVLLLIFNIVKVLLNKMFKCINLKFVDFRIDNYIFWLKEIWMNDVFNGYDYVNIYRVFVFIR